MLRRLRGSKFAAKSLAAIAIKIGAAGASFAMFVVLARALDRNEFGYFGFAFSLATIISVIGSFGQRNLVLRFASIYFDRGELSAAFTVIRRGYLLVIAGCGALGLAVGLGGAAGLPFIEAPPSVLAAAGGFTLVLGLAEFLPNPQRAAGHVWLALLPRDIVFRLLVIAICGLIMAGLLPRINAAQILWAMVAMLALLVIAQSLMLRATNPFVLARAASDVTDLPQWRATMWGMWGNSVVSSSGRNIAIVVIGAVLSSTSTGALFAALRTAMVLELFLVAINIVAAPMLATRLHDKDYAQVQRICTQIGLMLGLPTLGAFLIFVFGGRQVLDLFGAGYASAHLELVVMSFGYLVSAFAGPTTQIMEMAGFERKYLLMLSVTTGLSLAAIPAFAAWLGPLGAALCISANLVALNVWAYLFIYRKLGIWPGALRFGPAPGK